MAGKDFHVPDLVGVADGQGVALAGAVLVQQGGQGFYAVPGGVCLHQNDRGQGNFIEASVVIPQRVCCLCRGVVVGGNRGGDGDPLFVDAHFSVGLNQEIAVLIGDGLAGVPGLDGVPQHGVAVGMGGIGHGEAVGVLVELALLVVGGLLYLEHLVIQLTGVLRAPHIGGAVCCAGFAHIQAGAGTGADDAARRHGGDQQGGTKPLPKFVLHNRSSLFLENLFRAKEKFSHNIPPYPGKIKDKYTGRPV